MEEMQVPNTIKINDPSYVQVSKNSVAHGGKIYTFSPKEILEINSCGGLGVIKDPKTGIFRGVIISGGHLLSPKSMPENDKNGPNDIIMGR